MYMDSRRTPLAGLEKRDFIEQIGPVDGKFRVSAERTQVRARRLPFYDAVELVQVKDPAWTNKALFI